MRFKVTMIWSQGEFDVSETYWTADLSAPLTIAKTVQNLLDARNNCMFKNQAWRGVRISNAAIKRSGILLPVGPTPWPTRDAVVNVPSNGDITITATRRPEQVRVAVNMRMAFGNPQRQSTRYFSSVPDSVTGYEPGGVVVKDDTSWFRAFKDFRNLLINAPWYIRTRSQVGEFIYRDVANVVQMAAAPSLVGLAFTTGTAPDWVSGTRIVTAGFRMVACACPSINGRWQVDSVNTTLLSGYTIFWLRNSAKVDPATIQFMGQAAAEGFQYDSILDALLVRAGIHQRGNSASRRRGRRKAKCCPA